MENFFSFFLVLLSCNIEGIATARQKGWTEDILSRTFFLLCLGSGNPSHRIEMGKGKGGSADGIVRNATV